MQRFVNIFKAIGQEISNIWYFEETNIYIVIYMENVFTVLGVK